MWWREPPQCPFTEEVLFLSEKLAMFFIAGPELLLYTAATKSSVRRLARASVAVRSTVYVRPDNS